jgi:starch synthase
MWRVRIAIGTTTRFHMFDLARALRQVGQDARLFTALPRFKTDQDLRAVTRTHPSRLLLSHIAGRLRPGGDLRRWEVGMVCDFGRWLGRIAAKEPFDVVDALDGLGLEAGRHVQRRGGAWICNRGSAHVLTQRELLVAEHERWREPMPPSYFDPWIVERCLAEYDEASAIVVPSRFAQRTFVERGFDPARVHVCPYGVDLSLFRPEPREHSRFRALFVGAQSIQKGIGYLLDAVRPLAQSGALELWLVGSTPADGRPLLERNADLFTHLGVQPRNRLAGIYSQASVLVMPSIQEGLALVQAQAMACGIPVIATFNTGAEDIFTDGVEGFIVPPRDAGAIRERLQFLLDNPVRLREMGAAALARVQSLGGWSRYGQLCRDMYRQVLSTSRETVAAGD